MRIDQHKSGDVLLVTERDEKQKLRDECIRVTVRSLTTLDFIGLVALTMFQHALPLGQLIDDANRQLNHDAVDK